MMGTGGMMNGMGPGAMGMMGPGMMGGMGGMMNPGMMGMPMVGSNMLSTMQMPGKSFIRLKR